MQQQGCVHYSFVFIVQFYLVGGNMYKKEEEQSELMSKLETNEYQ
jgi:hypothetical protein